MKPNTLRALQAMGRRIHPLQWVEITFAPTPSGLDALTVFNHWETRKVIRFQNDGDKGFVLGVIASRGDWGFRPDRKVGMAIPDYMWNQEALFEVIRKGVEDVSVISVSPLKALQSAHVKKRDTAEADISSAIFTKEFVEELNSLGLTYVHAPIVEGDFSMLHVRVENQGYVIASMYLDGWTGNILDTNKKAVKQCISPVQVKQLLKMEIDLYLGHLAQATI
jgi:hypothetical protein